MHQLASSLFSILLSPFNWIILLLIVAWLLRKRSSKRIALFLALGIFLLFGNAALFNFYAKTWQAKPVAIDTMRQYSCGIVAGGFASPDEKDSGYFNSTADRFIQAVKLYRLGIIKHILVSGGNGKTDDNHFREGAWVKGELITFGVPDSVIFVEDKSNNTNENAMYSKQILDAQHLQPPYLLITSAYHIPRAALIFQKAGVPVVPFPCNYTAGRGRFSFWDLLPKPSVLMSWDIYLKEGFGYLYYKMK